MNSNESAAITINDEEVSQVEENVPSYLITIYVHDKDTERFMPICHVAQSGAASGSLPVIEACLASIKKEFCKFLRPANIQISTTDMMMANNFAMAANKIFQP